MAFERFFFHGALMTTKFLVKLFLSFLLSHPRALLESFQCLWGSCVTSHLAANNPMETTMVKFNRNINRWSERKALSCNFPMHLFNLNTKTFPFDLFRLTPSQHCGCSRIAFRDSFPIDSPVYFHILSASTNSALSHDDESSRSPCLVSSKFSVNCATIIQCCCLHSSWVKVLSSRWRCWKKKRETFRLNIGILLLALLEWKYIKIQVASSNKTN